VTDPRPVIADLVPDDAQERLKQAAAKAAVEHVQSGMVLGLGTGSTTRYAVHEIIRRWQAGALTDVVGVSTSNRTTAQAAEHGFPIESLQAHSNIDLAIDGADEVLQTEGAFFLIKGLGGALLREKAVELRARRFVVISDDSKRVERLGTRSPVPVEIQTATWQRQRDWLTSIRCQPRLRGGDAPYVTDNGNYILDCHFEGGIDDPRGLAAQLDRRDGVEAHGLFLDMATDVILATEGGIEILTL
jgi:ribose 5-phosphate isomerase A